MHEISTFQSRSVQRVTFKLNHLFLCQLFKYVNTPDQDQHEWNWTWCNIWNLGNRMARGYRFDTKWICPMGSYAWGIQVSCSRNEMVPHFSNRTEHVNTSGITSHGTDSFRVKPTISGHTIPTISTRLTTFLGSTWKTIYIQERTLSEKRSDGLHKKCSIEL